MTHKTNESDKNQYQNAGVQNADISEADGQLEDFAFLYSSVPVGEYPEARAEDMRKQTPSAKQISNS